MSQSSGTVDLYGRLYQEKMKEAEWYKKPAIRVVVKTAGCITIVALVVIASMSAHALLHPLSSVGTIGHNLLGLYVLKAVTAAGFVGSAVLSTLLIVYVKKSIFRVSDYLHEDRGFLYEVKNSQSEVVGFLYGTVHKMPSHFQNINGQVKKTIDQCERVYVECFDFFGSIDSGIEKIRKLKGVDFKVISYAYEKEKQLGQLESCSEQSIKLLKAIIELGFGALSINNGCEEDKIIVAWQKGDEECIKQEICACDKRKKFYKVLIDDRNASWMPEITSILGIPTSTHAVLTKNPSFIAVGSLHLFDLQFEGIEIKGLISRLREENFSVTRIDNAQPMSLT